MPVRSILSGLFVIAQTFGSASAALAFGFDEVAAEARALALQPWRDAPPSRHRALLDLSYDDYRDIRFRPDRALWQDRPFELMFFHAGRGFSQPLQIEEIDAQGRVQPLQVPASAFDYGRNAAKLPALVRPGAAAEVAGFRLHTALNRPDYRDELIVFLGASYFRALGAGQQYGLSARGLAVDTTGGQGEEFPRFDRFWLEKPAPDATRMTLYARLVGPRVTGAYRFDITPGRRPEGTTRVEVQARLFLRGRVATLGLAPLTSMFLSGENQPRPGDFRPEVHDSDGLQILTGRGEWIWRPLNNPRAGAFVTSFRLDGPQALRGFGLLQRDRRFASYEDLEAHYERRPSAWVEPRGDWGPGRVELLQFQTPDETHDNIAAYWVPETLPAPGAPLQPIDLAYTLHWFSEQPPARPGGWTVQTRRGHGYDTAQGDELQFHVDFAGPALDAVRTGAGAEPVRPQVEALANARIREVRVQPHPQAGGQAGGQTPGWRMTLRAERLRADRPVELRGYLMQGRDVLTETWSLALPPEGEQKR